MSSSLNFVWTQLELKPDPVYGPPLARSSHGLSYLSQSNQLFLYGGEHVARTPLEEKSGDVHIYAWLADLKLGEWKALTTTDAVIPPPRIAHAQAVCGGDTVYIFGGRAGITMQENAMNDLWSWNASTQKWTELTAAADAPECRSFHRMVCVGNTLYVFGGCGQTSGRLADLYSFDTVTNTWTALPVSGLKGRGGPNLIPLHSQTKLGVISGFCGHETNDGHIYDISANQWDKDLLEGGANLRPRSVCVSAAFPSWCVALIFGGEVDPSERGHEGAGGFANDLVVLDESTGAVSETIAAAGDSWPGPRGWADAGATEDCLYLFGGLAGDDEQPIRLNDLWQLQISKK